MTGSELRYLRKHIGMTQQEFGNAVGYSKEHISDLEHDKYEIKPMLEMAAKFMLLIERLQLVKELI